MPQIKRPEKLPLVAGDAELSAVSKEEFDGLNPSVLGLGDLDSVAEPEDAVVAMFDLSGFTKYCANSTVVDVSQFVCTFLKMFFEAVRDGTAMLKQGNRVTLKHRFPCFAKFTGDGVLLLWPLDQRMNKTVRTRLIRTIVDIVKHYDKLERNPDCPCQPPPRLRCGVAIGKVYPVGRDKGYPADYVGPSINLAARLQAQAKEVSGDLPQVAVAQENLGLCECDDWKYDWKLEEEDIRGVGIVKYFIRRTKP